MEHQIAQPQPDYGVLREAQMPIWRTTSAVGSPVSRQYLLDVAHRVCMDPAESNKLVYAIVPKTSLNRRGTLTPAQAEQTDRLGRLFGYACRVFGDDADARAFMRMPHPELHGQRPLDAVLTERGGRAVESILDALLFGLPV